MDEMLERVFAFTGFREYQKEPMMDAARSKVTYSRLNFMRAIFTKEQGDIR